MKKELKKRSLELIQEHEKFIETLNEEEKLEQEAVLSGMKLMFDFILNNGKLPE